MQEISKKDSCNDGQQHGQQLAWGQQPGVTAGAGVGTATRRCPLRCSRPGPCRSLLALHTAAVSMVGLDFMPPSFHLVLARHEHVAKRRPKCSVNAGVKVVAVKPISIIKVGLAIV